MRLSRYSVPLTSTPINYLTRHRNKIDGVDQRVLKPDFRRLSTRKSAKIDRRSNVTSFRQALQVDLFIVSRNLFILSTLSCFFSTLELIPLASAWNISSFRRPVLFAPAAYSTGTPPFPVSAFQHGHKCLGL